MSLGKAFIRLPDASPGIRNDVACHIENADFVKFLETQAMTVGQNVPYRRRFRPHDHERQLWRSIPKPTAPRPPPASPCARRWTWCGRASGARTRIFPLPKLAAAHRGWPLRGGGGV